MPSLRETAATYWCFCIVAVSARSRVLIDIAKPSPGELRHFWDSTGLCPPAPRSSAPQFLLSPDERFNLAVIGSLPNHAISQVRIHWLLDLISVSYNISSDTPLYNFTYLDQLLDWLQLYKLDPGFELMGNPSNLFSDFSNDTQVEMWRNLIQQVAERYIDRYGLETVTRWRFETWNEPDLKSYNIFNFTLKSYLRYFGACHAGLQDAANGQLRLGGPAGLFKAHEKHPLCWGLLQYCANQVSCPMNFISFHKKGGGLGSAILQEGLQLVHNISILFPALRGLSFANDEADPLSGWSKSEPWRADVRYGAMVAAVIIAHQKVMVRQFGLPLELLSNDNAFLNYHPYYFSQRTLLARFQMNNTDPPHVQFIRKPVYSTMSLLSFLGSEELHVDVRKPDDRLSVLAAGTTAQEKWSGAVLLVFSNETVLDPEEHINVTLRINNIPATSVRYVLYMLDNVLTNPNEVWKRAGAPVFPDQQLRDHMRAVEIPHRLRGPSRYSSPRSLRVKVPMSLPSVALLHICTKQEQGPGKVSRVIICNVTYNEVLIFWSDINVTTRCIKTYEVEFGPRVSGEFRRINPKDSMLLSFQYAVPPGKSKSEITRGFYRIRAVDYWNRPGTYSSPVLYPGYSSCA